MPALSAGCAIASRPAVRSSRQLAVPPIRCALSSTTYPGGQSTPLSKRLARGQLSANRVISMTCRASQEDARSMAESEASSASTSTATTTPPAEEEPEEGSLQLGSIFLSAKEARAKSLFARRLTVIGFGAALIGEKTTGRGCVSALGMDTGVPMAEIDTLVFVLAGLLLFAAFQPSLMPPKKGQDFMGQLAESAEYIVDSALCLAFAASLIVEALAGKGVLAALGWPADDLGMPLTPGEATGVFLILLFLTQGSDIFYMDDTDP